MRSWGYYNYWRFGRKNRRKGMPPATSGQFADHFHITAEQVEQSKLKKELTWPIE
jgi:hypothetical protein